jgi:hypothetical protein
MADQVKAPIGVAAIRRDSERIIEEMIEAVVRRLACIRSRACRITALAWGDCAISCRGQRGHLRAPHMERFRKTMQQQRQRRAFVACNHHVEN